MSPTPRPPKDEPKPPVDLTVGGGGGTSADKMTDVFMRLGSIQSSVTYLEATTHDTQVEVKSLSLEFANAKGSLKTLKWIVGVGAAVTIGILGYIAEIAKEMAKHYLHW